MIALPFNFIACFTCIGDASDPNVQAANMAILFMLFLLVLVLGSFVSFIVYLARKSKNPDIQAVQNLISEVQ